jgi:hypothetical protein
VAGDTTPESVPASLERKITNTSPTQRLINRTAALTLSRNTSKIGAMTIKPNSNVGVIGSSYHVSKL